MSSLTTVVYTTDKVETPELLRNVGYGNRVWVEVERWADYIPAFPPFQGTYRLRACSDFTSEADCLEICPESPKLEDPKDQEEAKRAADKLLEERLEWLSPRFHINLLRVKKTRKERS